MFHPVELYGSLLGITGTIMLLDENSQYGRAWRERNHELGKMPDEIRSWVEKRSPTFRTWTSRLREIRHYSSDNPFGAEQQCKQLVEALEDIEAVMSEGANVSQTINIAGSEKELFDGLINCLSRLYKHYRRAEDYLAQ